MLTVRIDGVDGVQQTLARLVPQSEHAVLKLAERIHELAVAGAEKHRKSGALVDAFGHGPKKIPGGWEIGANRQRAPHALFVHWGTKPHPIFPKGASLATQKRLSGQFKVEKGQRQVLRWAGGGAFIFARFVNHPGYKGDPFLINAANQALREFPRMVEQSLKGR